MQYFRVRNWEKFQHYQTGKRTEGTPSWIKIYTGLLDDYDFSSLPDASKGQLISVWMLAARTKNKIPFDPKWVGLKIGSDNNKLNLQILLDKGFIEMLADDGQTAIADCYQGASTEEKRKEEKRRDIYGEFQKVKLAQSEYQKLVERFGEQGAKDRIKNLDQYIASKGKKYADHYATILAWDNKDKPEKKISKTEQIIQAQRAAELERSKQSEPVGRT